MSGKNIIFNDKKINKSNFYRNKKLFKTDNIDINKILVSKRGPYGKKSSFKMIIMNMMGIIIMMIIDHYV